MPNEKTQAATGGIGFCGALTILFVALKLCNVISWSWWWVLAPLWIPFALIVVLLVLWLVCTLIAGR